MRSKNTGITLLELMIAVVVVAILAGIAYPSYMQYVMTSRRSEAMTTLIRLANLEERYYLDNNEYGDLAELGLTESADDIYSSESGYYTITVVPSAATYTLTATAAGSQSGDSTCATFSITQDGKKTSSGTDCWN